jgi:hypothetical protein
VINEDYATQRSAREAAAAAAFQPPVPPRTRERRRVKETATLAVLVLAVLGFASYEFVASAGHAQRASAAAHPPRAVPAATPGVLVSPATADTAPAATAPASTAPASTAPASTAPASTPPPQVLTVASLAAFGPAGLADGDNPQGAGQALAGDPAAPWDSDWYASPDLDDAPGTGLLLDMGRTVTVTSVRVSLGGDPGASLQLRAGAEAALAWLPQVASVSDAGGTVELRPSAPVHVRYVLIWFTQLPPDPAGTYQASVYQVIVRGQP